MAAGDAFHDGRLADALAEAKNEVRQHPTDLGPRMFLAELLAFAGELEQADKHLAAIMQIKSDAAAVQQMRQLLRAELSRQEVFEQGRVPEFASAPPEYVQLHLKAIARLRDDDPEAAAMCLAEAEMLQPELAGRCDGEEFTELRDLDDVTSPVLEVLTATGKYYWVPLETVRRVEFRPPESPRDLLWRSATMEAEPGPAGEVFIPTIYAGSCRADRDALKLGRETTWQGEEGQPIRGLGQRMLLVDDEDRPLLSVGTLEFDEPA